MANPSDLLNPYESPAADEWSAEQADAPAVLPRTASIWTATIIIWCIALGLASVAGYILLAWVARTYPAFGLRIQYADELAQFATGAANAIVMAGLVSYGQYNAVIRREPIWSRSIAMLLMIASLVVALGSVLLFAGSWTMWLLFVPAAFCAVLSLLVFQWYGQLVAFRRQQRRKRKPEA